jgi:hypothetical protein
MRRMAASVLVFEAFIALFFGLVVAKLDHSDGWVAAVVLGAASVLLSGIMRFRWAYGAGWVLQAGFIVSGVFVADMYVLGAIFAALWWAGLHWREGGPDQGGAHGGRAGGERADRRHDGGRRDGELRARRRSGRRERRERGRPTGRPAAGHRAAHPGVRLK